MKKFRDNGAVGALLDEYERSVGELKEVISKVSNQELVAIVDHETNDVDCRSIQTVLTHVIRAGYNYVVEIRRYLGEELDFISGKIHDSIELYKVELDSMFAYNEKLFEDYPNLGIEEFDNQKKVLVRWGQSYDIEQLFEHAIVHILRHRRQIERFLIKLK